jgi:hypothetical protein
VVSPRVWDVESVAAPVFARENAESLVRKVVPLERELMEAHRA